ncbi:MAG: 4Fe-4S dicluster domain-containing protein [Oligoflexia bacterium]|nr:4Fe-4S dicluster domain-containing protein [Oligoflexia bacterium]
MSRWGMAIDLDKCTACGACVSACKQENNVPPSDAAVTAMGRTLTWIQVVTDVEGTWPEVRQKQYPLLCLHCDNPPCIKVCPVSATYIDDEGIVGQIYNRCIGCRYCTNACPYSVKLFNWFDPKWPDGMDRRLNPDVSVRPRGVVEKCTFCHHRLQHAREETRAQGRSIQDVSYTPACVEACPAKAMTFGDLEDPKSDVTIAHESPRAFKLLDDLGTEPKVVYLHAEEGGE